MPPHSRRAARPARTARTRRLACAAAIVAATVAAGLPAGLAAGATSGASVTVSGGSLGLAAADFTPLGATLTGADQTLTTTTSSPWTAVDARGTGAPWTVVASAADLVSAGTPNRVIPSGNIAITTGVVTAGAGADAVAGIAGASAAAFTVPTGPGQTNVALLTASGPHRGGYAFAPRLDITLPATALPSYPGVPYASTLTVTIS